MSKNLVFSTSCTVILNMLLFRSGLLFFFTPGSVSVLPTVLYLLLGVLRELVREYGGVGTELLVPGTLQALRTVLSSPMSRVEKSRRAWVQLLRSALTTLLMCWNTGKAMLT